MNKKILITGGCGFIGSHFVRMVIAETDMNIANIDLLTYAGDTSKIADISDNPRYKFYQADISDRCKMTEIFDYEKPNIIVNFAAETHVDNSIANSSPFIKSNVSGTQVLLDLSKKFQVQKYIQISTDEVYGDLPLEGADPFRETTPLNPSSPYSASKAAGDLLVQAFHRTYDMPTIITRCCNNYGTHQFPEKLIPFFVSRLMKGEKLPVYGDGKNIREWIAVEDHNRAVLFLLQNGKTGEIYNIGSGIEKSNLEITKLICANMDKNPAEFITFVSDRLGHDRRYAINCEKLTALGWKPAENFEQYFTQTINFYKNTL